MDPNIDIFKQIENSIVDNVLMIKVATKAQAFIRQRVERGIYLDGSTGGSEYSTRPMPVPYGLFIKKFGKTLLRREGTRGAKNVKFIKRKVGTQHVVSTAMDRSEFSVFRSKSGHTMVLIQGGYKRWREMNMKSASPVDMSWSSRMLRNLGILRAENLQAEIGFSSASESEKAYYQHIGAGKNKVKRIFMDLSPNELDQLGDLAEKLIFQKLSS